MRSFLLKKLQKRYGDDFEAAEMRKQPLLHLAVAANSSRILRQLIE